MPDLLSWLDAVRARLTKAMPGPWYIMPAPDCSENIPLMVNAPHDLDRAERLLRVALEVIRETRELGAGQESVQEFQSLHHAIAKWQRLVEELEP